MIRSLVETIVEVWHMAQLSPGVKEKKVAKWEQALKADLYEGEVIWAFVAAMRVKPGTDAVAVTNARVIAFNASGRPDDVHVRLEVAADEIRGIDMAAKRGFAPKMTVVTDNGEVIFGQLASADAEFARYYVQYLWDNGVDPVVATAIEEQEAVADQEEAAELERVAHAEAALARMKANRGRVTVIGSAMKDSWWEAIARHSHGDELPWFIINGGQAGRLAAFEDRLLISKTGGMTSFMAGALGGGRETVFPYSEITNIQYNGGMVTGVLEILTPSFKGTGKHDFWRSSNNSKNSVDDDPWKMPNCLPLNKIEYRAAQPLLNEVQQKVIAAKQPQHVSQPVLTPVQSNGGLADELERLADMHQRGLLDSDEFKAAKQAAIARMS